MTNLSPLGMDSAGQEHIAVPGDTINNTTSASTTAIQKGSGSGGLTDAIAGTDFELPISRSFSNVTASIVTGTGATGTQISSTRDASVSYAVTIATTATIATGASGTVVLEICSTNSATPANWIEISRITNGQVITLAITLQSVQTTAGILAGIVPAGYYRKLRSINNSGTPTFSSNSGQEVLL